MHNQSDNLTTSVLAYMYASSIMQALPQALLRFCREISDGMNYLSQKRFVHADLAARNILLDDTLTCKVQHH